jgi:hypothetical protein
VRLRNHLQTISVSMPATLTGVEPTRVHQKSSPFARASGNQRTLAAKRPLVGRRTWYRPDRCSRGDRGGSSTRQSRSLGAAKPAAPSTSAHGLIDAATRTHPAGLLVDSSGTDLCSSTGFAVCAGVSVQALRSAARRPQSSSLATPSTRGQTRQRG